MLISKRKVAFTGKVKNIANRKEVKYLFHLVSVEGSCQNCGIWVYELGENN
jgi:hypothetical protein